MDMYAKTFRVFVLVIDIAFLSDTIEWQITKLFAFFFWCPKLINLWLSQFTSVVIHLKAYEWIHINTLLWTKLKYQFLSPKISFVQSWHLDGASIPLKCSLNNLKCIKKLLTAMNYIILWLLALFKLSVVNCCYWQVKSAIISVNPMINTQL